MKTAVITVNLTTKFIDSLFQVLMNYNTDLEIEEYNRHERRDFITELLEEDNPHYLYIENGGIGDTGELYLSLIFATDYDIDSRIVKLIGMRTLQMRGVIKPDGLLLLGCHDLPGSAGKQNNRRKLLELEFEFESYGVPTLFYPSLISEILELPEARRQSRMVVKRIEKWDIYLKLLEEKAKEQNVIAKYDGYRISESKYLHLNLKGTLSGLNGKSLRNATARIGRLAEYKDEDELVDHLELVGSFLNVNTSTRELRIELSEDSQELVMLNEFWIPKQGMLHLSKMGDLIQTRRLQSGLKRLARGKAINPNIENILFGDEPLLTNKGNGYRFNPNDMLRRDLNKYQKEAVRKALAAEDVFLIQGPPGTGKTTVIAEICYQNAIRGLKTLIASQSNLAVDNALSKLVHHPKIRALRKGNASRVEDEGRPFTEELVIDTWMNSTARACREELDVLKADYGTMTSKRNDIEKRSYELQRNGNLYYKDKERLSISINELTQEMNILSDTIHKKELEYQKLKKQLNRYEDQKGKIESVLEELPLQEEKVRNQLTSLQNQLETQLNEQRQSEQYINELNAQIQKQEENQSQRDYIREEISKLQEQVVHLNLEINPTKRKIEVQTKQFYILMNYINRTWKMEDSSLNIELVEDMVRNIPLVGKTYEKELSFRKEKVRNSSESIKHHHVYKTLLIEIRELQREVNIELSKHSIQINEEVRNIKSNKTPSSMAIARLRKEFKTLMKTQPLKLISLFGRDKNWKYQLHNLGVEIYQMTNTFESIVNEFNRAELQAKEAERGYIQFVHSINPRILTTLRGEVAELKESIDSLEETVKVKENERQEIQSKLLPLTSKLNSLQLINSSQLLKDKNGKEMQRQRLEAAIQSSRVQLDRETQKASSRGEKLNQTSSEKEKELQIVKSLIKDQMQLLQDANSVSSKLEVEFHQKEQSMKKLKQKLANLQSKEKDVIVTSKKLEEMQQELVEKEQVQDVKVELLQEWVTRLEKKEERDKSGLKQIYIDSANVIGITCVQSGSLQFSEEYPDFDVVIIDEVSKATPPEILLPMLKGKKVILVGDHKQLPPMIGDDTLNEVIENGVYTPVEKEEMKEYLKESLFERLFHAFDDQWKETLRIQYRMHPHIMQTINQFYKDGDGLGLISGLENPDKVRNHGIDGKLIRKGQHILWLDTPLHPSHYEKQAEGGTSFYNETEIQMILGSLTEINDSLQECKDRGLLEANVCKEVGIISFYGEQVKRLQQLVLGDKDRFKHLSIRIGTVDRFQGMERDIILASFVRNNPRGDIGFAKEYKRVNVAMSRAKELLIVTGCSELFCHKSQKRYPDAAKIYQNILREIGNVNGHVDILGRSLVTK